MVRSGWNSFISSIKFFDLLLEQFSGSEGELPLAITYLAQAVDVEDGIYKATLIRIAKAKIRHADIMGSILLQIAKDQIGPLSIAPDSEKLENFLINNGFHNFQYQRAIYSLDKALGQNSIRCPGQSAKIYIKANIHAYIAFLFNPFPYQYLPSCAKNSDCTSTSFLR